MKGSSVIYIYIFTVASATCFDFFQSPQQAQAKQYKGGKLRTHNT